MLSSLNNKNPKIREKLLNPFLININPNIVTVIALIVAVIAGIFFYYGELLFALIFVLLNGFLDILDGQIAKKYKRTTKLGDFLDHTADRIADVAILLGITLSAYVVDVYGYALIIATLLTSYLGTQAQALTNKRIYGGLIGRSDRLILIAIFVILEFIYPGALYDGILVLLLLTIITFIQRFIKIWKVL